MENKINPKSLLSSLWTLVLFNIIFRDLHEFLNQGYIEEMMNLNISEETMLFYGLVLEIPILMTVLSRILNNAFNKWINLVTASIIMVGTLSILASADMDDVFFTGVSSIAFLAIIYTAWKLPSKKNGNFSEVV